MFNAQTRYLRLLFSVMSSISLLLTPAAFAHGISDAQKQRMLEGGYGQYVFWVQNIC